MNTKTKGIIFFGVAFLIVILDQLTKWIIVQSVALHERIVVIPGLLNIYHITNTGAGFGLFRGYTPILAWISFMVVGIICYYYPKIQKDALAFWLCSFILGGTVGNLIDRVLLGGVIDFVDFRSGSLYFPTFNVADMFISVSAIVLIVYLWKQENKKDSQKNAKRGKQKKRNQTKGQKKNNRSRK